ncbi:MAG: hypothetical protein QXO51_02035 [Halobacteria archaeon]
MRFDLRGMLLSFAVTVAGLALGLWQSAALAGAVAGAIAKGRPVSSAVAGAGAGWLLFLLLQMAGPGGRVASALGSALGLPGGVVVFVLGSLGVGAALAALGASVGRGLAPFVKAPQKPN